MQKHNIKLNQIQENLGGELAEIIHYECEFCQKTVGLYPEQRRLCERLSGKSFYCSFCLQNNFNTKNNQHVLLMSFKGIIGYYYYVLHGSHKSLYQSQIMDYVEAHQKIGLMNPVFRYDPESFLWFIDFSKVGRGGRKIPIKEVLKTVINILATFELPTHVDFFATSKLYKKYNEAVLKFYTDRYRPTNKKILAPTLSGCGGVCDNRNQNFEEMRNFKRISLY